MPAIRLDTFKGEIPSYSDNLLPNDASAYALDCHFDDGTLNPIMASLATGESVNSNTKSMYRYEDQYWFSWSIDVDVIKSPVARDPWRRVYWTDGVYPKVTYNTIFNGSGSLPSNSYQLGVPSPTVSPTITQFTPPLDIESAVTVFYLATYVTEAGEEGAPSPVSARVECAPIGVEVDSSSVRNITLSFENGVPKIVDASGLAVTGFTYSSGTLSWSETAPASGKSLSITASQVNNFGAMTPVVRYSVKVVSTAGTPVPNTPVSGAPTITITNDSNNDGYLVPSEIPNNTVQITVLFNHDNLALGGYASLKIVNGGGSNIESESIGQVTLSIQTPGINKSNIQRINLYRTASSGDFLLVANLPLSQSTYVDKLSDGKLGGVLSTETYSMPPDGMKGLCSMPNGICAGFIQNEVLFSEVYLPYAWPEEYRFSIDYDIVAIEPIGSSLVVGTTGDPYLYTGISPGNIAGQKLEISQACVSKASMLNIGYAVIYACPDGLVAVAPDGIRLATEEIIKPMQWRKMLDPSTIKAYRHEAKYIGIHSTGAFIFDIVNGDFRHLNDSWNAGFTDPKDDTLYIVDKTNGSIKRFRGGTTPKTLTWKSKEFDAIAKSFSCCRIVSDDITKVEFNLFVDGSLVFTKPKGQVKQTFTLPFVMGDKWQFELKSDARIESVKIATSKQELKP